MAQYSVRLYINSGFNTVNIPDSPALLESLPESQKLDVNPVYIVSDRQQTQLIVKATKEQVENVDYCKLGNWYYAVTPQTPLNDNTQPLELNSDGLLSAGGIWLDSTGHVTSHFDIIDGVISRSTVAQDQWGEYTEEDPLCAPQEPLKIVTEWIDPPDTGKVPESISGDPILIESTVDLCSQGMSAKGKTYTDSETGKNVTVPRTYPIKTSQEDFTTSFEIDGSTKTNGTEIFIKNDTAKATGSSNASEAGTVIDKGMANIRSIGIENGSIISQYRLPREFFGGCTVTYPFATGDQDADTAQRISLIKGVSGELTPSISPNYATVKNKRVLYGGYNKYGLMTCAGNSGEFDPEEITEENTPPAIAYKSDPRAKGKPYYRFATINSNTEFWRNAIAGSDWENVPLVYQGASGSALTRLNFDNQRKIAELNKSQYEENYGIQQIANGLQTGAGLLQAFGGASAGDASQMSQGISSAINGAVGLFTAGIQKKQYMERYNAEKANELSGLYQSTTVYTPTVNFPYNADILRDIHNNGVLLYKYQMSDRDIARIDKLLTMYGYRHQEVLTPSCFYRHTKFDYVACSNVSITGLPRWWNEEISGQLKNGVRIWHVLPNSDAYNDNPVRKGAS